MAIVQGVDPHNGWVDVGGQRFQVIHGQVVESSINESGTLRATVPLNAPGYLEALAPIVGTTKKVKAIVLAHGSEWTLMTADITKIEFCLVAGTIEIHGDNGMQVLNEHKTTDTWTNKKGHEIVQDLVGRLGIPFSGVASKVMAGKKVGQDYVRLTDGISYMMAIHKHAEFDGVRAYMDRNGTFQYRPPGTGGDYAVNWQRPTPQRPMLSDCLDLRITHNLLASADQDGTLTSYLPAEKKNVTVKSSVPGSGDSKKYYHDQPNLQQEQAYQRLNSLLWQQAMHEFSLSCTVVGDPSVDASQQVTLSGSQFFDQGYPIDTVTHVFGINGYTTTINSKNAGKGRSA